MLILTQSYAPSPKLAPYVRAYHAYDCQKGEHPGAYLLPEGIIEVVFQLTCQSFHKKMKEGDWQLRPSAFVGGLHNQAYRVKAEQSGEIFSICFHPGAFASFSTIPLHLLKNQLFPLAEIWGLEGKHLEEMLRQEESTQARIERVESFLIRHFQAPRYRRVIQAAQVLERLELPWSVSELSAEYAYSPSRFRQLFNEVIGIAPKEYQIIRRLQKAQYLGQQGQNLTQVAMHLGYHDQAHFIRECKKLTGLSPRKFFTKPSLYVAPQ